MKNRMYLSGILLILIVAGILFGIYLQVKAQPDVVSHLKERLRQQNVPVVEITILQKLPIRLQVAVQSRSDGEKAMPEDPINLGLVRREVSLASQQGYLIERFTVVLLNNQGEPMGTADHQVNIQNMALDLSAATIDNDATKKLMTEKLNLYGMSLTNMEVTSMDGLQFVTLQLSTASLEEANQVIVGFMGSLQPLLAEINAQGAQIAVLRLELKDGKGNIILTFMIDLQTKAENGWMADGLAFPQGPPSAEPAYPNP